jgi:hypothetical protein
MSTPEPVVGVQAERPAERALFHALFDDAAVFPPALVPLPQAVADHVARQGSSYAGSGGLVGPLLLPSSAVEDFLKLRRPQLAVAVIARPGTDLGLVGDALARLHESPDVGVSDVGVSDVGVSDVIVSGVEIGWSPAWHRVRALLAREGWGSSLSVEVPRGADLERALSDLQEHADDANPVQAKFRTGSTPDQPVPTPTEVANFIRACVDRDLGFKLTGGLHHAISTTTAVSTTTESTSRPSTSAGVEDQFGFLNVIAATRWALAHGAEVPEMESLLSQRDPVPILDIITRMSAADASVVRAFFTAYGCCAVMDPIGDLVALGLIEERTV